MIQELFGGNYNVGIIGAAGERSKPYSCGSINLDGSPSHSSLPSSAHATATSGGGSATPTTTSENLRCPRCDSSNTKFCYYNNYNLTQPRHFCKTCRRYWTKGGALRNVPIGGGCRKNKSTTIATAAGKSNSDGKMVTVSPDQMGQSGRFDYNQMISQNPILWASSQNSHLLSLLRANPKYPNPNHLPNSVPMKDEAAMFGSSHFSSVSARALGLDSLGPMHVPSSGLSNSFYRNQAQAGQAGINMLGEVQSNYGLQELYQRLRSSASCYPDLGNVGSGSSSTILESAPVATGDQLGFWNSTLSWPTDLHTTTSGAYP